MISKKIFTTIILGSVLGFLEATLGYFFHLFSLIVPGIAGFFMFPVAFLIFKKVYHETGNYTMVFLAALVTAAIKLSNLFFPVLLPASTINPSVSIILEAGAFVAFMLIQHRETVFKQAAAAFTVSLGWRIIFLAFLTVTSPDIGLLASSSSHIIRFLLIDSIVNGFLITFIVYLKQSSKFKLTLIKPGPVWAVSVFFLALVAEMLL